MIPTPIAYNEIGQKIGFIKTSSSIQYRHFHHVIRDRSNHVIVYPFIATTTSIIIIITIFRETNNIINVIVPTWKSYTSKQDNKEKSRSRNSGGWKKVSSKSSHIQVSIGWFFSKPVDNNAEAYKHNSGWGK